MMEFEALGYSFIHSSLYVGEPDMYQGWILKT